MMNIRFNNKLTHYWLQSVRLCFARTAENSTLMLEYPHNMSVTPKMIDTIYTVVTPELREDLSSTDCDHLKNPIDILSPQTARLRPAVSSLEACPTSAL